MSDEGSSTTEGELVGKVTHYFTRIGVAVVELTGTLKKGDLIRIKGNTTDFTQPVESMQVDRQDVSEAGPGQSVGVRVKEHVREHDRVYKVAAE